MISFSNVRILAILFTYVLIASLFPKVASGQGYTLRVKMLTMLSIFPRPSGKPSALPASFPRAHARSSCTRMARV